MKERPVTQKGEKLTLQIRFGLVVRVLGCTIGVGFEAVFEEHCGDPGLEQGGHVLSTAIRRYDPPFDCSESGFLNLIPEQKYMS